MTQFNRKIIAVTKCSKFQIRSFCVKPYECNYWDLPKILTRPAMGSLGIL